MSILLRSLMLALALLGAAGLPAQADDWLVRKSRGTVEIQTDTQWIGIRKGAVVADGTLIRTGSNGHATLARGKEWVALQPGTLLVIHDRDGKRFTNVVQMAGTVEVEVDVRNVEHFAVNTPYLAAVVKGTHFTVRVHRGTADVAVGRGLVQVDDLHGTTYSVPKGQQISIAKSGAATGSASSAAKSGNAGMRGAVTSALHARNGGAADVHGNASAGGNPHGGH